MFLNSIFCLCKFLLCQVHLQQVLKIVTSQILLQINMHQSSKPQRKWRITHRLTINCQVISLALSLIRCVNNSLERDREEKKMMLVFKNLPSFHQLLIPGWDWAHHICSSSPATAAIPVCLMHESLLADGWMDGRSGNRHRLGDSDIIVRAEMEFERDSWIPVYWGLPLPALHALVCG